MKLYTIYDKVAEMAGPVFCAENDGVASRQYRRLMKSEGAFPGDYKLLRLGEYDEKNAHIVADYVAEEVLVLSEEEKGQLKLFKEKLSEDE